MLLSACGQLGQKPNDSVCNTPPPVDVAASTTVSTPSEQATLTKSCIHRWSYRLSNAPGSNSEIAKAVIGGCREALMRERNLYLDSSKDGMTSAELETLKLKLEADYTELALFHVVQARAGHCKIP
jgi:hypothetical protein